MLNEDELKGVIAMVLNVDKATIGADASMDTIPTWDSVRHMTLVLAIEEAFGVSIPDEDAANITSYALIKLVVEERLAAKGA